MALRKIVQEGDEILRKESRVVTEITDRTKTLIEDMWDTLEDAGGVGLAAVQVGVLRRIFIIDVTEPDELDEDGNPIPKVLSEDKEPEKTRWTMINPEILWHSDEVIEESEGCLSIPGVTGVVARPAAVLIGALDENGEQYEVKAEGLFAKAFFHELDHLGGTLFIDRATDIEGIK